MPTFCSSELVVRLVLIRHFELEIELEIHYFYHLSFMKLACVLIFGDKDLSGNMVVPPNY